MKNPVGKLKLKQHDVSGTILRQAKKEGNIVYGAQAIKRKLGINARPTMDYDVFSKTPRKSAKTTETDLDKLFRKNVFYTKKGKNITTYKVKHIGKDAKPKTKDDITISDYTKTPKPEPKTFKFRGVKYRVLKEELAAKKKLLSNRTYGYRREKDLDDFRRIKMFGNLRRIR